MATTTAGASLTDQHRRRQLALRALTVRNLLAIWPAFDLDDISRSWEPVEASLAVLVDARRRDSAGLAAGYFSAFRTAEGAGGTAVPQLADRLDRDRLLASLRFAGPAQAARLLAANRHDASSQTLVFLSGSVTRHVLNGGRDTISRSVESDRRALGYARVTSAKPCAFCAMVAGRGAIYKQATAAFEAHDHCACSSEPVYRGDQPRPGRGGEFHDLWNSSTAGLSGPDARLAFRRAYEAR